MFEPRRKALFPAFVSRTVWAAAGWVACLMLSACSGLITPYRAEVVQGNFVSREQVQALRIGMPRQAVRDILGTPLVTSLFHANRWDYAFTIRRQGAEPQLRHLSVFFKGDTLERIEGDPLPTEAEFAAKLDTRRPPTKLPELKASDEALAQFPPKAAAPAPAPSTATPPATYPPLEAAR